MLYIAVFTDGAQEFTFFFFSQELLGMIVL